MTFGRHFLVILCSKTKNKLGVTSDEKSSKLIFSFYSGNIDLGECSRVRAKPARGNFEKLGGCNMFFVFGETFPNRHDSQGVDSQLATFENVFDISDQVVNDDV